MNKFNKSSRKPNMVLTAQVIGICAYGMKVVATLFPSLLYLWALYLSKSEKFVPSSSRTSFAFSRCAFTLGEDICCCKVLRNIASTSFDFSLCQNMEEVSEQDKGRLYLK